MLDYARLCSIMLTVITAVSYVYTYTYLALLFVYTALS